MVYNSVAVCVSVTGFFNRNLFEFLLQGFPNEGKGCVWRGRGNQKFYLEKGGGGYFLPGEGNMTRNDFDNLNQFKS